MRYLTNDLAKLLGVSTNTIRRYENDGFFRSKRDPANYRYYEEYDIRKAAVIRLYIKCGFSLDEIRTMMNNQNENIQKMYINKLEDIDKQIERLKRLRHWLKDNIELMNTINKLRDDFFIMNCPALRYVIYSIGDNILKENDRFDTVKYFMYEAPEVQLINLFRFENLKDGIFTAYTGWAIKEIDIEKFHMEDMISTNKYIEFYPSVKCIYGTIEISLDEVYNKNKLNNARKEYLKKVKAYLNKNNYFISGDMVEFLVNALGDTISILVCLPISEKS